MMASLRFAAAYLKQLDPEVFDPIVAGQWLDDCEIEGWTCSPAPP